MRQIHICEVGPRDGLQNAHHLMPTEAKKAWIAAMAAAGLEEIEVGSFVAPNVKGFERAVAAGAHKVTFPVSASRAHSAANVRMTPEEMVAQVKQCVDLRGKNGPEIEAGVSTAFGCTMQGEV